MAVGQVVSSAFFDSAAKTKISSVLAFLTSHIFDRSQKILFHKALPSTVDRHLIAACPIPSRLKTLINIIADAEDRLHSP